MIAVEGRRGRAQHQARARILPTSEALLRVEADDEHPVYVVVPMTTTPPPDMPGYGKRRPEEVRCTKHGYRVVRVKGKLLCPWGNGHYVNADGSSGGEGTRSSQRGERQ
jgi:hypothetical protein